LEEAAKGATKAALEFTEERLTSLVEKFITNRDLAFIEDKDTLRKIREQRKSSEYLVICQFIPKGWLRTLVGAGLELRELGDLHAEDNILDLRDKVRGKYGAQGLRVAELAQSGIVKQLLLRLISTHTNAKDTTKVMVEFLEHADEMTLFVEKKDAKYIRSKVRLVTRRVDINPPHMMILLARADAKKVLAQILQGIREDEGGYVIERETKGTRHSLLFLHQKPGQQFRSGPTPSFPNILAIRLRT